MADGNSALRRVGLNEKRTKSYLLGQVLRFFSPGPSHAMRAASVGLLRMLCVWLHFKESENWQSHQALMDGIYLTRALSEVM